jgi:hypothetical protein
MTDRDNSEKIFALCSSVTKLGEELNALLETVKRELEANSAYQFVTVSPDSSQDKSDWLTAAYADNFGVKEIRSGRGRRRQLGVLSIAVDTGRADFVSGEAHRALVIVGYTGADHESWELADLVWPLQPNAYGRYALRGPNLVEWIDADNDEGEVKRTSWKKRTWAFFVPLHTLVDAKAVAQNVIEPAVGLLNGKVALDKFEHPEAVRFELRSGEIALADRS